MIAMALRVLERFLKRKNFPPVIYFGTADDEDDAKALQPAALFMRNHIRHDSLILSLGEVLLANERIASTNSLFVGDMQIGIHPLIKGYRFIRRLGSTEHSGVYLAERESSHLQVVLKVLRQMPERGDSIGAFDRFLQEYETIAELDHPNIVKIYDLGVSDDHAHIAMEYLDGGDLRNRIDDGVSRAKAVNYLRQNRERADCSACQECSASRFETRQHHAAQRWDDRPDRLWPCEERQTGKCDYRQRRNFRHTVLHESGAGPRCQGRRAQ